MLDPNPNEGAAARGDHATISEAEEVTATVTSTAPHARETPTLAEFMSVVVAWPGPNYPGYVNLHYSMPNTRPNAKEPLIKGMGWPYKTADDFVRRASGPRRRF